MTRIGSSVIDIQSDMKNDVTTTLDGLVNGGPRDGFTFTPQYNVGDPQSLQDDVSTTSVPLAVGKIARTFLFQRKTSRCCDHGCVFIVAYIQNFVVGHNSNRV